MPFLFPFAGGFPIELFVVADVGAALFLLEKFFALFDRSNPYA